MRGRVVTLLMIGLMVLAGCTGLQSPAEGPTPGDVSTVGGPTAAGPSVPEPTVTVSVTAVVDGDTIRIEYANGTRDTVRLVGVDTPEVHTENDPPEFEGVPDTEAGSACLREAGVDASTVAKDRLLGRTVGLAFDPNLDRRGYYDRLLAYVVVEDRLFNYRLVREGHARVYDSPFTRKGTFERAETTAREAGRGLWRCAEDQALPDGGTVTASASGLVVTDWNYDAPGNDNENLDAESITFRNDGTEPLALAGWTVADAAGHRYTFGEVTLSPSASVRLHTGTGTDTDTDVYWGQSGAVWNNDGDRVVVRNAAGDVVLERAY